MKAWLIGLSGLLFTVLIVGSVVIWARAPEALRLKLESTVAENCSTCRLKIGSISLGFGDFAIYDLHFTSGVQGAFQTEVKLPYLHGHLSLRSLFKRFVVIHHVVAKDLFVSLTDGDLKVPPKKEDAEKDDSSDWHYLLQLAVVENGKFLYTRNHNGTSATLNIHDIHASLDEVGNTERTLERISTMIAHFQIEKSGEIELHLGVPFFVKPLHIDVNLTVKDQNLADLNPFFDPNAGVDLKGVVRVGEASAEVRGQHLKAKVRVAYEGFDLSLKKTYDRTGLEAFFTNLGADLVMAKNNLQEPQAQQTASLDFERKPDDSIVSFILQGLKDTAIKVTRK